MGLEDDEFPFWAVTFTGRCELKPLPETNLAPKNGWLEYYFPIDEAYLQGRAVSFREGSFWECRYVPNISDDGELMISKVALLFPGQGSQYVKMMANVKDMPAVKDKRLAATVHHATFSCLACDSFDDSGWRFKARFLFYLVEINSFRTFCSLSCFSSPHVLYRRCWTKPTRCLISICWIFVLRDQKPNWRDLAAVRGGPKFSQEVWHGTTIMKKISLGTCLIYVHIQTFKQLYVYINHIYRFNI